MTPLCPTRIGEPSCYHLLAASELDNFLFEFGLSFAFCDERIESFVNDIGDPHTFSLRCLTKPSHRGLVQAIERPAAFKNKWRNIARSWFWDAFHVAVFRCYPRARKKLLSNNCVT
jgi:hypothetical protein